MPPELLVPVVLASLALVLGACWAVSGSAEVRVTAEAAAAAVRADHPERAVTGVDLDRDGRAALVATDRGRPGGDFLVVAVGANLAVRDLARATVEALPDGVRVTFGEGPLGPTPPVAVRWARG